MSIATANPMYWELKDFECFSSKQCEGGFIRINYKSQQPIRAVGSESFLTDNPIDGTYGKLGLSFTSADELEEIDIGPRDRPRPTYEVLNWILSINKNC